MDPSYAPPLSNSDRISVIIEELQVDLEKSAALQAIIEMDIETRDALWEELQKSQEAAEDAFRKESEKAELATEKELKSILTSEQMETYRELMRREEPPPDDFMFDVPGDAMEPKDLRQDGKPAPVGGDFGNTQAYLVF
jgi:hypothetical protein